MFTIVIPTHNRKDLLARALRSVAAQCDDDYEVVVIDDGSSDQTASFLAGLAWERLRHFRNDPPRGASGARNRGVVEAAGDLVIFLDDDDELRPNAVAELGQLHRAHPELAFMWGCRMIHERDAAGRIVEVRQEHWNEVAGTVSGSSFLACVLRLATSAAFTIRRDVFLRLGGFKADLRVSEDRELFIRLAYENLPGRAVQKVLVDFDEHFVNSLSRTVGVQMTPNFDLSIIAIHREYLERHENAAFLDAYLQVIYEGFLRAGQRRKAFQMVAQLAARHAWSPTLLRLYLRSAPESRWLKKLVRYADFRRLRRKIVQSIAAVRPSSNAQKD